jgi:hypothetical protein
MNTIYLAKYSKGDWDDYHTITVFVSADKKKIENWVEKFNSIVEKWKKYYFQFEEDLVPNCDECRKWIKDEYIDQYFDRWIAFRDINEAFLEEIELR